MKQCSRKYKSLFGIGTICLLLSGCMSEPTHGTAKAVIEGWIDSGGSPMVIFTASLSPDDEPQSIADKIIRWGKVTVSDGEQTIILTGGPDKNLFPPFSYYTYRLIGVPGRTYRITAEYEDLYAEASCTMPYPTPIDSLIVTPIEGNDSLRSATLCFTAPTDTPAYYYVTVRKEGRGTRPYPAMMGTVKALRPGENIRVPVFNAKNQLDTASFVPQLKVGQNLEIALCRVTEEVYNFWTTYENAVMFGGSLIIDNSTGSESVGNIAGGYGVWSVQGVSKVVLEVE